MNIVFSRISVLFCLSVLAAGASAEEVAKELKTVTVAASPEDDASVDVLLKNNQSGVLGNKTILDTPFSITVVDEKEITERGAKSIGQIFVNDASIYTPTSSSTTDWWGAQIRGLPVRNYYVNDIPVLLYWGGDFPVEAVESVTALKGLTGFMYGFGEPGGAISYKLKSPTKTPETTVNLGYRNSSLFSANIDTSQNLSNDLAMRVNVATENGTAYNASKIDRSLASVAIDKGFGESFTWFTHVIYEENSIEGEPLQFYLSSYDVIGSDGKLPVVTYDYDDFNIDNSYYNTETLIASTGVEWQLTEQWDLRYQTGFSRKDHKSNKAFATLLNREGDYSGDMYNFAGVLDNLFHQIMLHGVVSTGSVKHEIVTGIGQSRNKERWGKDWYWSTDFNGNIYEEQTFLVTRKPDFSLANLSWDVSQVNVFASDTMHFNEHWQVIVGLRYNEYESDDLDHDPTVNSAYDVREVTPTVAVIFKPNEQTSLYGSYVEALEPGTRVSNIYKNAGEVLDATISSQYELGVKHESGSIDFTAALFRIEKASQRDEVRGTDVYYLQDGLTIFSGAEFSGDYQVADDFNVGLGVIYLDASIENVTDANIEGNDPGYASEWQIVTNAEYRITEALKLHGNVRYFGESYIDDSNTLEVPSRRVANMGLSYEFQMSKQSWEVYANVYNLFDEKYWAGGGWAAGNVGEARNFSLGLEMGF